MNASVIVEDVVATLSRRFGRCQQPGKSRVLTFGETLTCSLNYSKLLNGHKFFFALPRIIIDPKLSLPHTKQGAFILLICGSPENILVLPRTLMVEMMAGVPTRRVDVFLDSGSYILQTTKHPKLNVTEFLNAFPKDDPQPHSHEDDSGAQEGNDRIHVRIQSSLIALGQAEGCSVWVPVNDRNLSYGKKPFAKRTLSRFPNFGFDENTRRIVQNIDVLWLTRNVILKAFEIESTTSVYSGLLRMNDLVLAQPNVNVDLYISAPLRRRNKVLTELLRPSFQHLLPKCQYLSFEEVEKQATQLDQFPVDAGARVSGLIRGERFSVPESFPSSS
jgi:hypothetical protein